MSFFKAKCVTAARKHAKGVIAATLKGIHWLAKRRVATQKYFPGTKW